MFISLQESEPMQIAFACFSGILCHLETRTLPPTSCLMLRMCQYTCAFTVSKHVVQHAGDIYARSEFQPICGAANTGHQNPTRYLAIPFEMPSSVSPHPNFSLPDDIL